MKSKAQQLAEKFDMCINGTNEVQDAVLKMRNSFMNRLEGKSVPKDQMIYLSDEDKACIWDTCRMYPNYGG
jgi:hypothetical protein